MAYTLSESPWLLEKQVAGTRYLEGPELNYEIPTELTLFADLAAITLCYILIMWDSESIPSQSILSLC